ncbi:hypothetical protein [Bacteroides fragilis]|uniref:hypothetical protein n=1 Tax=Bacteroides TaxID=816 RepID=UPI0013040E2B|nr:hypothetical protein [Bacteroides fragilis]
MKKTECALVKVRQTSAKGQQCPEDYIFLFLGKFNFQKELDLLSGFPTFLHGKTRPALVKARSLYFSMAACLFYPGRFAIEIKKTN